MGDKNPLSRFAAVIFDMDGLMLDTEPLYAQVMRLAGRDLGVTISDDHVMAFNGLRTADCSRLLIEWFGPEFSTERFWQSCRTRGAEIFTGAIPLKAGLLELLDFLEARQIPKAVATSTRIGRAKEYLQAAGLLARFAALAGGDEVAHGKPAPDLYLLAAKRLGVAPAQCLALEDSEPGALSAHRAGMQVGMIPDLKGPSPEIAALTIGVFDSLTDLIPIIDLATRKGAGG